MRKIFSLLKFSGGTSVRNPSLCYPIRQFNNVNSLYKRVSAVMQRFILLFHHSIKHIFLNHSFNGNHLLPPESVRGMKKLDRNAFIKTIQIPCLNVAADKVAPVLKVIKPYILKMTKFKISQETENAGTKYVYLNPESVNCFDDLKECRNILVMHGISHKDFFWKDVNISYDNWSCDVILKSILPLNQSGISGYSIVGHILHLNLRDHLLEYKNVIGEVLVDKVHNVRTVVNKTSIIDSKYRNFSMEILSGESDMNVCVRENGYSYKFDFSKVYWNPRLSTEHFRITCKVKPRDVLFDVFAGVGPFAIPAAKKKCTVLANDLNPDSFQWLCSNVKLNKVASYVETFNMDGRDFICKVIRPQMFKIWEEKTLQTMHIVMNLPATAVEFLNAFIGLGNGACKIFQNLPIVHCYCFVTSDGNYEKSAQNLVEKHLNCTLDADLEEVIYIRNVSPNKQMMRVSFRIPKRVLFVECNVANEPW